MNKYQKQIHKEVMECMRCFGFYDYRKIKLVLKKYPISVLCGDCKYSNCEYNKVVWCKNYTDR